VVVVAGERVLAVSEEAERVGLEPGLTLRQAEALCPTATVAGSDPAATARLADEIAAALLELAPAVEVRADGRIWMDLEGVTGVGRALGEARDRLHRLTGALPRLGLAPGPFTAAVAAARARPGRVLVVADARAFLAPLPVRELGLDPEREGRLELLGLRTLGAVAALGPHRLETQLGPVGRTAALLARGEEPLPLRPWRPPAGIEVRRRLDPPVEDAERLGFVARALVDDLVTALGRRGAGARRLQVRLGIEDGAPEVREGAVDPLWGRGELLALVVEWLRDWRPAGAVNELGIEVTEPGPPGRRQLGLWRDEASIEEVDAALERLRARHGPRAGLRLRPGLPNSPLPLRRYRLEPR